VESKLRRWVGFITDLPIPERKGWLNWGDELNKDVLRMEASCRTSRRGV